MLVLLPLGLDGHEPASCHQASAEYAGFAFQGGSDDLRIFIHDIEREFLDSHVDR